MTYKEFLIYLHCDRKITQETMEEFNISFIDKQGYLFAYTTFPEDFRQLLDIYYDSIIFPIYNLYNEPIAIMARKMCPSKSKYINSSNSDIYTKGRHLYGMNKSYPYILKENRVIVTEGTFDMLQLYQSGIKNVVGMLGTALTPTQVALLSRFTENIVVLPDPDKAGDKFGYKSSKILDTHVNHRYVKLPVNMDPDEFVISNGVEELKKLIQHE